MNVNFDILKIKRRYIKLIDKEKEFKVVLTFLKKWCNHWLTPSARRKYAGADSMKEPAKKTLEFINSIDAALSFEEKLNQICTFSEFENEKERSKPIMGTDFYSENIRIIEAEIRNIKSGNPAIYRNINR